MSQKNMKRIALVIAIASLVGCASTGRQEIVDGRDLQQQMEAYIDDYLDQVLNQCVELHGKAGSGESPVDCAFQMHPTAMHLSFPSIPYYDAHYVSIVRLEHNWCAAAQAKTGKPAAWIRHFRREGRIVSRPCFKGDELRHLLEATAPL